MIFQQLFTMDVKTVMISFSLLCCVCVYGEDTVVSNETELITSTTESELEVYREKVETQTKLFEKGLRNLLKGAVKSMLPSLMTYNSDSSVSTKCMSSLLKYISGITSVKVWALKMLDATSKLPSGVFEGTVSDFGGFDSCLEIEFPTRAGKIEFRGQYCAIEVNPLLLPVPKNFSMAKQIYAHPLDSIGQEIRIAGTAFNYLKFRFGVCVPSACTLKDIQAVAKEVENGMENMSMIIKIPQCYAKKVVAFRPVHIVVILLLSLLLAACIGGTIVEYISMKAPSDCKLSKGQQVLMCFSFISNFRLLMSTSIGSDEMTALHGIRVFSIAWVILFHTHVWTNFQLVRRPKQIVLWFNGIDFGPIVNGWLCVVPFFVLSGLLTSYAVLKMLSKTQGRINVPYHILRRYIRLTPSLLLAMGLLFFLPVISSGPFWYEKVDPEIKSCTEHWWRSILYISNWFGMKNICIHPTWFLSADFQLHVISLVTVFVLYRCPKLGLPLIASLIVTSNVMIAVLTYLWELPPIVLMSSGNQKQIENTVDVLHMNTLTHAGPYNVGILTGYLIYKYKNIKMSKMVLTGGWFLSALISLASLYGAHTWSIGEFHGPLLTAIYAAVHRTAFSLGIAWVVFACVVGYGGLVNRFLSSSMLVPVSRLTFMIYLLHSLVMWTRIGSMRERMFFSHYNFLYEFMGHMVFTILIAVPFYLLLETPVLNLERLLFPRANEVKKNHSRDDGHFQPNITTHTVPVELMSVKHLQKNCNNLAFMKKINK